MIVFNKVTWYSKLAAVILFLLVVPTLTFYIGTQYQLTKDITSNVIVELPFVKVKHPPVTSMVKNPISFYAKEIFKLNSGDKVWSFGFDINHDGREDVFVSDSTENTNDGKTGKFWILFVNNGNGTFSVYKGDVNFSIVPFALGYGIMNQDASKSLVTYVPESADSGSLVWYKFEDGKIVSHSKKIKPSGKDSALYDKYIRNGYELNMLISIDEIPVLSI